jgi:hypothetical protein
MTATTLCVAHHSNGRAWPDGHTAAHGARLPLCAAGSAVLNHACIACPAGFTSLAGDDPNAEKDTFIAPHTKASGSSCYPSVAVVPHTNEVGHTPNDLCAANEHVVNHVCTACAAGKTNTAGDDRHHHDTECTTTYCSTNEYVSSNVCTACPVHGATGGPTYNTAGDDASGPDTKCQAATGYDSTHQ